MSHGLIELGGTKTLVAVATSPDEIDAERIPTTTPEETLDAVAAVLASHSVESVGVATFGPIDLDRDSPGFGRILNTPKRAWVGFDLIGGLVARLGVPVEVDTDVNAAARAEMAWGALKGLEQGAYVTVGTGIGGGLVVGGDTLLGAPHPEIGHVMVQPRHDDPFPGCCPYHRSCLEGMASGPAIAARFSAKPDRLSAADTITAVRLAAHYLGQGLRNVVYAWAPERIVIGGGVSKLPGFHRAVARELQAQLANYPFGEGHDMSGFVVPPGLGDRSGLAGALAVVREA